jgi:zinc/manganese transport system permease protein
MFSGPMLDTWAAASMVAVVAGVTGFFVVLRRSAFVAHALPHGAFGGGAGAYLLGVNTLYGLGAFAAAGAVGIGWLGRRGRRDVATALSLAGMLALGALFLSWSSQYSAEVYSLLFGEVLGVARSQLPPMAALGAAALAAVALLYRRLLLVSVLPEVGQARRLHGARLESAFLLVVAMATTMAVPVVGALLVFSLTIGPAGAARSLTGSPGRALWLSGALALATVWGALALSYATNWPVGFFVGMGGVGLYASCRGWAARRRRRHQAAAGGSVRVAAPSCR